MILKSNLYGLQQIILFTFILIYGIILCSEVKMGKGIFITLEGGEGTGKSSQIGFIKKWLEYNEIPYIATREPGGTQLGEQLKDIIKFANYPINKRAELMLLNACRTQLMDEVILPNLEKGVSVVCDRFFDSTYAYQYKGRGLNKDDVVNMCNFATFGKQPDYTFWLDLNPRDAFIRKNGPDQTDRFETTDFSFHERVYEGYKELNEKLDRFIRIDASKSIVEVSKQIEEHLKTIFNK